MTNPRSLSIAGFDPCGGAGTLADIQTFQNHQVQGMAVVTAITYQDEESFSGIAWETIDSIKAQLSPLLKRYRFRSLKIGIIENFEVLDEVLRFVHEYQPDIRIVWDPVLKSSSGFDFTDRLRKDYFVRIINRIDMITPNYHEEQQLNELCGEALSKLSEHTGVLSKGGHTADEMAVDQLHWNGEVYNFSEPRLNGFEKHGSGCVLSAAITANLALGADLPKACEKAKAYITRYLQTSTTKLGLHYSL